MILIIIVATFIFLSSILLIYRVDFLNFNPFKNKVKIPESIVETFVDNRPTDNRPADNRYIAQKPVRNLVFTSAGDKTNFYKLWPEPEGTKKTFDIMTVYYGDNQDKYAKYSKISKHMYKRKGSKFQKCSQLDETLGGIQQLRGPNFDHF